MSKPELPPFPPLRWTRGTSCAEREIPDPRICGDESCPENGVVEHGHATQLPPRPFWWPTPERGWYPAMLKIPGRLRAVRVPFSSRAGAAMFWPAEYGGELRTWHVELAVVALVLWCMLLTTGGGWRELVGSIAVLLTFCHGQVASRLAEQEAVRAARKEIAEGDPLVDCHAMADRYFLAKEATWLIYFVALGAWSALVGCAVFLAYPVWRRYHLRRRA